MSLLVVVVVALKGGFNNDSDSSISSSSSLFTGHFRVQTNKHTHSRVAPAKARLVPEFFLIFLEKGICCLLCKQTICCFQQAGVWETRIQSTQTIADGGVPEKKRKTKLSSKLSAV